MEPHIYGVTEVNQLVKGLLDSAPALQASRPGRAVQLQDLPLRPPLFHPERSGGGPPVRHVPGTGSRLRFRPENGMKAVASGRITVFPRDGAYQSTATP